MSENDHNRSNPTPDMEAFYHQRFAEWDREKEQAQSPEEEQKTASQYPKLDFAPRENKSGETFDPNGFRILTLHLGGERKTPRRELPQFPTDEEEEELEALLEKNSSRRSEAASQSAPPAPEETDTGEEQRREESAPRIIPVTIQRKEPVMIQLEQQPDGDAGEGENPAQEAPPAPAPEQHAPAGEESAPEKAPEKAPKAAENAPAPEPDGVQEAAPDEEPEEEEEQPPLLRLGRLGRWLNSWFEERMEEQGRQISADEEYERSHPEEKSPFPSPLPKRERGEKVSRKKAEKTEQTEKTEKEASEPGDAQKKQMPEKREQTGRREKAAPKKPERPEQAQPQTPETGEKQPRSKAPSHVKQAKPVPKGKAAQPGKPSSGTKQQRSPEGKPASGAKARTGKVIQIPEEHPGLLEKKFSALREHADEFVDAMFVGESDDTVREEQVHSQVAKLIPATDEERAPKPKNPAREERRRAREEQERHAPDTSPRELYRIYSSSYKSQRGRLPAQLAAAAAVLAVSAAASGELPFVNIPYLQANPRIAGLILTLGLVAACAIGLDTLLDGILRLLRGKPGMNTLSSFGAILAVADGVWYSLIGREGPLPFCGFAALSLWAMAYGNNRKKRGLRDACEDAYTRSEYERLTMDDGKWSGRGVFVKEPGSSRGFGSQIQEPDGVERVYRYAAPVMIAACFVFGIISAVEQRSLQMLLWNWSVIFVLATPLSATLAYGLPYSRQVRRLRRSGAVLAGWDGVETFHANAGIVLTDRDLFPDGCAQFTGIQNFGDVSLEKLTGCTASIVREADLGLARIFDDQVRIQGGFYRRVDNLDATEEGGYTGVIRGDTVMIGSSGYLQVHGIPIEPGYQVKNAVFCAINGRIQGSFALNYSLPRTVKPAIQTLLQGGISPILATRDFNIQPDILRRRFKLPAERMQYPPVQRRFDLSAKGQPHNKVLGALIFREGIVPYTDAILGGKRLRSVVRFNLWLTLAASAVGALLGLYLTGVNAFHSLSLVNTLFFLLMWLVPTVLISNGVDQF